MSDLAVFCIGIGMGLLIVLPVFYVAREEIAENVRRLFRESDEEGCRAGSDEGVSGDRRPQGISSRTRCSAAVHLPSRLYGVSYRTS